MATTRRSRFQVTAEVVADSSQFQQQVQELQRGLSGVARRIMEDTQRKVSEGVKLGLIKGIGDAKIGQRLNEVVRKGTIGLGEDIKKALAAENYKRAEALENRLRIQNAATEHELQLRKKAAQDIENYQKKAASERAQITMKAFEQGMSKMGGSLLKRDGAGLARGLVENLRGGGKGLQKLGRSAQERAQEWGERSRKIQARAERAAHLYGRNAASPNAQNPQEAARRAAEARSTAASAGKSAQAAQSLAKVASATAKIGAALGVIAGVAGALLVLLKLFMDLEKYIKDMNKELVQTSSTADWGFSNAGDGAKKFAGEIDKVRDQLNRSNKNFEKFNAKGKEQMAIAAALSTGGFTWEKQREAIESTKNSLNDYVDVTGVVLSNARALGVESSQMATAMGEMHIKTGLDLEELGMQFSTIVREARDAQFATKRFYSAVVEATSGMAFYGQRVDETAKLLTTMGKLIGQVYGEDVMKQIAGKYGDNYQDMLKTVLVKGTDQSMEMYAQAFKVKSQQFHRDFGMSPEELERSMASSGSKQDFLVKMQMQRPDLAKDPNAMRELGQLYTLREAKGGDLRAMATAGKYAGLGFQAEMALTQSIPLLRKEGETIAGAIDSGSVAEAIATQKIEGIGGLSGDQLVELARRSETQAAALMKLAEKGEKEPQWAKDLGVTFKDGKAFTKDGFEIKGWRDLFRNAVETKAALKENQKTEYELASDMWQTTQSIHDVIEVAMLGVLQDIWGITKGILELMPGAETAAQREERAKKAEKEAQEKAASQREQLRKKAEAREKEAEEAAKKAQGIADPEERAKLEREARYQEYRAAKEKAEIAASERKGQLSESFKGDITEEGGFLAVARATGAIDEDTARALTEATGGTRKALQGTGLTIGDFSRNLKKQDFVDRTNWVGTGSRAKNFAEGYTKFLEQEGGMEMLMSKGLTREDIDAAIERSVQLLAEGPRVNMWEGGESEVEARVIENFQRELGLSLAGKKEASAELTQEFSDKEKEEFENKRQRELLDQMAEWGGFMQTISEAASVTAYRGLLPGIEKPNDFILPSSGPLIMPHSDDTIIGMKPGGPLAGMLGGGKGGNYYEININGNDATAMYNTLMEVLNRVDD